jgi:hypothetical protein
MGRHSKVDKLPAVAREALIQWLSDPAWTRQDATEALHALLDELGHDGERPAVDSVNRYAQRYEAQLQRMRERTEVANAWIGQFGRVPEGKLGQMVIQLVHGLSWELGLKLSEGTPDVGSEDMPAAVRMLRDLAVTIERTERASSISAEREAEIRTQAAAEAQASAADRAADVAQSKGISPDGILALRKAIMGAL